MDTKRNYPSERRENDIILSKTINAGKRIYYLDVKQNRKGELFLVITESKKVITDDETQAPRFEKHKIFLYKEDFEKFSSAFEEALSYIKENNTVDFVPAKPPIDTPTLSTEEEPINLDIDF